jgi:hypothetical protein
MPRTRRCVQGRDASIEQTHRRKNFGEAQLGTDSSEKTRSGVWRGQAPRLCPRNLPNSRRIAKKRQMFDYEFGTVTRRPGGVETPNRVNRAFARDGFLAFAVGEPETYVQAPKAKGFRNRTLFGFPTPRSRVYRAVCGGAPQTFLA